VKATTPARLALPLAMVTMAWAIGPLLLVGLAQAATPTTVDSAGNNAVTTSCSGVAVGSSANLVSTVSNASSGTTFCLQSGTFSIGSAAVKPKDGDKLIGVAPTVGTNDSISATSKIVGTGAQIIDVGNAKNVDLENLDVSGATGTSTCSPQCGRGISQGNNLSVAYSRIHNNAATGIGGGGSGGLFSHLEVDHNGSSPFTSCCAGGIKSAHPFTVDSSFVHDNVGNGVWEDVCGTSLVVTNNTLSGNTFSGARYEHNQSCSGSATITGNLVTNNNLAANGGAAGIAINSVGGATVANNTLGGNIKAGIKVGGTRGPVTGTSIHDSTLNKDVVKGCTLSGVTCYNNI
jgi:hypothetical protein